MFFTAEESKINYQEVSHLFASLIKHGGNYSQENQDNGREGNNPKLRAPKGIGETPVIESFLIGQ